MGTAKPKGWYPDPSGQPKKFRWWDGTQWTEAITETLWASEPRNAPPWSPVDDAVTGRHAASPTPFAPAVVEVEPDDEPGSRRGLLIGALVALIVVLAGAVLYLALGNRSPSGSTAGSTASSSPESSSSSNVSPPPSVSASPSASPIPSQTDRPSPSPTPTPTPSPTALPNVVGGRLVYERPGNGWTDAQQVFRFDIPNDQSMTRVTEPLFDGKRNWAAPLVVGDLPKSADSKGSLSERTRSVALWFLREEWGFTPPNALRGGRPVVVAGRNAFRFRTSIAYELKGLKSKRADVDVVLVDFGPKRAPGVMIAVIPENASQLWKDVDRALATTRWTPK